MDDLGGTPGFCVWDFSKKFANVYSSLDAEKNWRLDGRENRSRREEGDMALRWGIARSV